MSTKGKTKKTEPIFMYNDEATFKVFNDAQEKCKNAVDKLTLMAEVSIQEGAVKDYSEFLENPMEYMTQAYWSQWGSKYNPPHADRRSVFVNSSNISVQDVNEQINIYNESIKFLKKKAPLVGEGIEYTVKKEDFDVYVGKSKVKEYKATLALAKAVQEYKDVVGSNEQYHLCRFSQHNIDLRNRPVYSNFK